jgi:predicted heme/steroid binding protein
LMATKSMREFSRDELARCDGKDGAPAYIAYNGKVYDVSNSYHWRNGRHHAMHSAGLDLTDSLREAPHAAHLLDRAPVVGILEED